jgi:hypothetical protein
MVTTFIAPPWLSRLSGEKRSAASESSSLSDLVSGIQKD